MRWYPIRARVAATLRIAGAGLAGLVAANALARENRSVDVYDKKSRLLPSSGAHTEGIRNYRSMDALDELRSFGFDLPPISTLRTTVRYSPHHRNVLHGPAHYLFMRGREDHTVDQLLYHGARAAGVRFHFGTSLDACEADIVATGPPADDFNVLGAGYTFSAEGSPLDLTTAYAFFDNEIAPAGYLVITPGRPFHSIYSISWRELRYERLLSMMEAACKMTRVREILGTSRWVGKIHGRAYYAEDPIAAAERNGTLYVGEAGGFQDAVAGFGFRYAVITGALAARALVDGRDYRELLKGAFGSEFRDAFPLRQRLNRATNEDFDRMIASLGDEISLKDYVRRREPRGF